MDSYPQLVLNNWLWSDANLQPPPIIERAWDQAETVSKEYRQQSIWCWLRFKTAEHRSTTILHSVDRWSYKFACKNLPSPLASTINYATSAYLDRLRKMIRICWCFNWCHELNELEPTQSHKTGSENCVSIWRWDEQLAASVWKTAYHPKTVALAWKPPSGGSDSKGVRESGDCLGPSSSSFSSVANTALTLGCVINIAGSGRSEKL